MKLAIQTADRTSALRIALWVALGLLVVDAAIGLGLVAPAYQYVQASGSRRPYPYVDNGTKYLAARPGSYNGLTSVLTIAACAIAFLLVGVLGMVTLYSRSRGPSKSGKILLHIWLFFATASAVYVLVVLAEVFTFHHQHQYLAISTSAATARQGLPYNNGYWMPETWYHAILRGLVLKDEFDRVELGMQLKLAQGWRWNLIPLFILSMVVFALGVGEAVTARRQARALHAKTVDLQEPQEAQRPQAVAAA